MTYLQLVNSILRRLREEEVSAIAADSYSVMVGDFVNDAMKVVEDAWQWSGLRTETTIVTVSGQQNYSLTSSDKYDIIQAAYNEDTKQYMQEISSDEMLRKTRLGVTNTTVSEWAWGKPSGGLATIDFLGTPSAIYNVLLDMIVKTDDLSADLDTLNVPSKPILYLALAYAARERGEVQGQPTAELFGLADTYLSDAIALDADRYPNETTWYAP
jgi:hypothetical protein